MSAHLCFNLLNELGEKMRCDALPSILSISHNEFTQGCNYDTTIA